MKKAAYQPTGNRYEIKTIAELSEIVTEENLPYILQDLALTFEALFNMETICQTVSESMQVPHEKLRLEAFNWIDDGKHDLKEIIMTEKETDLKLVIDKDGVNIK